MYKNTLSRLFFGRKGVRVVDCLPVGNKWTGPERHRSNVRFGYLGKTRPVCMYRLFCLMRGGGGVGIGVRYSWQSCKAYHSGLVENGRRCDNVGKRGLFHSTLAPAVCLHLV